MNEIRISKEDMKKIIEWNNNLLVNDGNYSGRTVDYFIFDRFVITGHAGAPVCVELFDGTKNFMFFLEYEGSMHEIYVDMYEFSISQIDPIRYSEKAKKEAVVWREGIRYITDYIMNYQRDRKEKHPIPRKYSREHRISTSQNKVYLLDDIVKYVHDTYVPQGGTHNIQCECWGVRGHYRTYKSGRKVWISAYKKGKKRNEMEPKDKTYYLSKGVTV